MSKQLGFPYLISESSKIISDIYNKKNQFDSAFYYLEISNFYRDSISNEKVRETALQAKMKHEFDEVLKMNEIKQNQKDEKNKILFISISIGLLLTIILLIIIFKKLKQVSFQNQLIEHQKSLVSERNKEITDSINYANKIQKALISSQDQIEEIFKENLLLFRPKDIVSVDFIWFKKCGDYYYLTLSDCTGHGVPGAFMSILGVNFLNEITSNHIGLTPTEILDQLRIKIMLNLDQKSGFECNKDGMDISLI